MPHSLPSENAMQRPLFQLCDFTINSEHKCTRQRYQLQKLAHMLYLVPIVSVSMAVWLGSVLPLASGGGPTTVITPINHAFFPLLNALRIRTLSPTLNGWDSLETVFYVVFDEPRLITNSVVITNVSKHLSRTCLFAMRIGI